MYRKHLPTQHYPSSSFQLLTWWELFQTSLRYKDVIDFKHWDPLPKNSSCLTGSLNDETLTSPLFHVLLTKLLFIQKTHSMSSWALLFCWCSLCLYCWNCKKEVLISLGYLCNVRRYKIWCKYFQYSNFYERVSFLNDEFSVIYIKAGH